MFSPLLTIATNIATADSYNNRVHTTPPEVQMPPKQGHQCPPSRFTVDDVACIVEKLAYVSDNQIDTLYELVRKTKREK